MSGELQNLLDAMLDGVVVIDASGTLERVNAEASRLLGASGESLLGEPAQRIPGVGPAVAEQVRTVLATGRASIEHQHTLHRRSAQPVRVDLAASPLFGSDGAIEGVVLAIRDLTSGHQVEEMVAERDQLESFGRIAAGLAHEVKNPLGGIRGAGEILAARAADGKTRAAAELIVREADRIAALVEDFMTLGRGDELRLRATNLHRLLDDVLDLLVMDPLGAGVEVERLFDPSLPEIAIDPERLTQVFLNLARNALQAMEGTDGKLTITTGMSLEGRLKDAGGRGLPTLAVEIRDTGDGIAPELLEKLPTPFFSTRPGGTGLGLALSRHWVVLHGGRIQLESEPGKGTSVRVLLPLREPS